MTWIYEALEMFDRRGRPLGKFRVVRWDHATPDEMQGLCDHHNHLSVDDALSCPVANRILDEEFSEIPKLPKVRLS